MTWTLSYNGVTANFADYNITNVRRVRKNLLTDKVIFDIPKHSLLEQSTFEPNSTIAIFHDNIKWFEGVVTQIPLYCSHDQETDKYELSGAWWYLENLIYQQAWKEPVDPTDTSSDLYDVYKSRVILGQDISGKSITIGEQISDVIQYANACGAKIAAENISLPVNIPLDECKDLSCAEIIRRLLRWIPDTIAMIDYSMDIPVINFKRRQQLETITIDLQQQITSLTIQPRYDLQVSSVILTFETTNTTNGKSWKEAIVQKWPINSSGKELKSLILTINLEGTKSTYIIQDIETSPILITSTEWWKSHVPSLSNIDTQNITINNITRTNELPNELISGNIATWMDKTTTADIIRCKISYKDDNQAVIDREVAVRINATDAETGTYKKLLSLTTAETIPNDLAEQIYYSVNMLQYDGNFTTISKEATQDFFGKTINIINGKQEWQTMFALVQEVIEYLDDGKIMVKLGPAKHLGAADLAELTRSGRLLYSSRNAIERTTAEATGNGTVEQGQYGRVDNTSFGTGRYKMIKFSDPEYSNKTVQIDTSDVNITSATVKFRQEDVCESGVLKKRYTLASEPFEQ